MENLENLFLMEYSSTGSGSLTKQSYDEINKIINKINSSYKLKKGLYVLIPNDKAPNQIADLLNEKIKKVMISKDNRLWPDNDIISYHNVIIIHKKIERYDNVLITAYSRVLGKVRSYFLREVCHIKNTNVYELDQKAKTKCININLKEKNYYLVD
ncbi:MAG: hypothetical protein PHV16_01130 [Candidatus Nanoarchaeia archaeon]|nr:hypothetical protein [Candidatus Nanoarchaeia archaeon]